MIEIEFQPIGRHSVRNRFWFIILACFMGGLFWFIFECTPIDNTLGGLRLFWDAAAAGAIIAVVISTVIIRKATEYESLMGLCSVVFCMMVGLGLISASAASFINRTYSLPTRYSIRATVTSKCHSSGHKGSPEYYLFIRTANGEERIQVPARLWESISPSATIELSLVPGYFGFPYILETRRNNT